MSPNAWIVPPEVAGSRLDRALAEKLLLPRNQVQAWIEAERVQVEGRTPGKGGVILRRGETVTWDPPPAADPRLQAEEGELTILHQDAQLIVLDKPPGLTMHPGAGRSTATLAHRLLGHFPELAGVGGPGRPGIVHRLDKDTSGVLVVARTPAAYEALSRAFAERRVEKLYLAITHGIPASKRGTIDEPIGRHTVQRKKMSIRAGGRRALTHYRTLGEAKSDRRSPGFALLELDLKTGRTHQIRVHLEHLRHPIAGDPTYGSGRRSGAPRLALHAWRLTFEHPATGERVDYRSPLAPDLAGWWKELGGAPLPALLTR